MQSVIHNLSKSLKSNITCIFRRRSKRYSAFGGNSPFGKLEAYVKLEQLGEGSYATVFKGSITITSKQIKS